MNWNKIINKELDEFILSNSPTKVNSRYRQARKHYEYAVKLIELDEEMAFIRLIAAEEEVVVAIFEQLKILEFKNIDFVKKFKNHYIKLALAPILVCLLRIFQNDFSFGKGVIGKFFLKIINQQVKLQMLIKNKILTIPSVFDIQMNRKDQKQPLSFKEYYNIYLPSEVNMGEFVKMRGDIRNKILYASDGGSHVLTMFEEAQNSIKEELLCLSWALAILLDKNFRTKNYHLISEIIEIYSKVIITSTS